MTKRLLVLPVTVVAALGVAVLPAGADNSISVKDDFFSPKSTTVKKGSTVTFRWAGKAPHNVTVKKGPVKFQSSTKTSGTYKKKMTRAGLYRITCTIHPGMDLALRVK
jgi:plastocyanin